jgi:hypothetical protein
METRDDVFREREYKFTAITFEFLRHILFGHALSEDSYTFFVLKATIPLLYNLLSSYPRETINIGMAHRLFKASFPEDDLRWIDMRYDIELMFEAAFVILLNMVWKENLPDVMMNDAESLLDHYPEFISIRNDPEEITLLLNYRNVMALAILVLKPQGNKGHLMELVTKITEGIDKKYITGSGQSDATIRREQIYERESGVKRTPRPNRKRDRSSSFGESSMGSTTHGYSLLTPDGFDTSSQFSY